MWSVRKILKIFGITLVSIAGLVILLLMLLNITISSQNIKRIVESFSKEYINADVQMDTIELHLLKNFPYASLSIKDCRIRSLAFEKLDSSSRALVPAEADSLARIGSLNVSISIVDLLSNSINIKGIELESPEIYGYISQFGINNWDILKTSSDTTDDTTSFELNISKISIEKGAEISLCSAADSVIFDFSLRELFLKGKISSNLEENYLSRARVSKLIFSAEHFNKVIVDSALDNALRFSIDTLDINKGRKSDKADVDIRMRTDMKMHGITMAKNIPLDLKGGILLDRSVKGKLGVAFDNLTLYAATLPITMNGSIVIDDEGISIPELVGKTENYSIKNILSYIPENFLAPKSVETDAAITLNTCIKGKYIYTTGELPTIDFSFTLPKSSLTLSVRESSRKGTLKNIAADISLHFDQSQPKSNILNISRLTADGRSISLDISGKVADYISDPDIDLKVKAAVNLDTLSAIIPTDAPIVAHGSAEGIFSLKGRASTLNLFSLSRNDIETKIISESLLLKMPEQGVDFRCGNASFHAGVLKNAKDTLFAANSKLFNVDLKFDTLYFNYRDSILVSGSKVVVEANQEPPKMSQKTDKKETKKMPPLKIDGKLRIGGMSFGDSDSTRIRLREVNSSFSVMPWKDGRTPVLSFDAGFRTISVVQIGSRMFVGNSKFALNVIAHSPQKDVAREKNKQIGEKKYMPDSTKAHELRLKRLTHRILKYWEIKGNVSSALGRIITPYFPLRTRYSNVDLSITNDGLKFQDAKFNIGKSSISLSGRIEGFAKTVTEHGKLKFTGTVSSDSLDIDQLLMAFSNSRDVSMADNRSDEAIEAAMQTAMESDTSEMKALLVPDFLEADINTNLNNVTFNKSTLKSVKGNLKANNGIFQLNGFKLATRSGEVDLYAFYAAKKLEDISVGFDMRMEKFEVADLIDFVPDVDTLFPMLQSFSGKITCKISAMSKMDSLMNLRLETMNGLATIDGENVVLMDGETFTDIAKMLKFKNKERNLIDKVSAQCVVADDKIEIFPFVIQMDRYKAAVSGTQNMDMSFKYHISVLKSPIPFRVGLNISGTTDDMKFKLGKCLYKDENVPVYTTIIDSARVNLGKQIKSVFLNGVERTLKTTNTNRLAKVAEEEQRKTSGMEDLSQNDQQQLEATKVDNSIE